jgi:L-rhamnose mutarotase
MLRKSFVMSVDAGAEAEYARRHNPILPELEATLKDHGVCNYSIFLLETTGQLFAYMEIDNERQWAAIAATQECQRWWRYMADIMPHNADGSPISDEAVEVFHLD